MPSTPPSGRHDPATFDGHTRLLVRPDGYADALTALVETLATDAEEGFVLLDALPGGERDGAPRCRAVWRSVEPALTPTWTGWANEGTARRWHRVDLPGGTDALASLAGLTDAGSGSWFVHTLALASEGEWTLVAVPHHSSAVVGRGATEAGNDALRTVEGCLAGRGVQVEWRSGGDRYRVEGGALRVDRDGTRHEWSLARLLHVDRDGATRLRLTWDVRSASSALGRAARGILGGSGPPATLRFAATDRRDAVADALESVVTAYPSRCRPDDDYPP